MIFVGAWVAAVSFFDTPLSLIRGNTQNLIGFLKKYSHFVAANAFVTGFIVKGFDNGMVPELALVSTVHPDFAFFTASARLEVDEVCLGSYIVFISVI